MTHATDSPEAVRLYNEILRLYQAMQALPARELRRPGRPGSEVCRAFERKIFNLATQYRAATTGWDVVCTVGAERQRRPSLLCRSTPRPRAPDAALRRATRLRR